MDIDELASDMGHAGDLADGAGAVEILEPGIAVGVHPAAVSGQVILGMLTFPISREPIPSRRWRGAFPRPFVAGIGPEPGSLGLSGAGCQHADGRVIGENRFGRRDVAADGVS